MRIDTAGAFQQFILTEEEEAIARTVNPYTLAYIQNKAAIYAEQILNRTWEDDKDSPNSDRIAIMEIERLRAQVVVLKELLAELTVSEAPPEAEENTPATPKPPAPLVL